MTQDGFSGDGVVPFSKMRADMRFPSIAVVRAYWEALRNGRDAPFRSEIDPRGIESALEHTFILERIAPRVARFRVAGAHLNDLMGHEVRGMPLTAFFGVAARHEAEAILARVLDGPETADLALTAELAPGRPPLEGRLLLLPMRSDLGDISRVLGCLVCHGSVGRVPRRFAIAAARVMPTGGIRGADRPYPGMAAQPAGCAEPALPFDRRIADRRRSERPYLRLVERDRD